VYGDDLPSALAGRKGAAFAKERSAPPELLKTPEPVPKASVIEPAPKRPAVEPTPKPIAKPAAKPVLEPTQKPALQPVAKPATKSGWTAKPAPKPVTKPFLTPQPNPPPPRVIEPKVTTTPPAASAEAVRPSSSSSVAGARKLQQPPIAKPVASPPASPSKKPPKKEHWTFACPCGVGGDDYNDDKEHIQCEICEDWQHLECCDPRLTAEEVEDENIPFYCTTCAPETGHLAKAIKYLVHRERHTVFVCSSMIYNNPSRSQ